MRISIEGQQLCTFDPQEAVQKFIPPHEGLKYSHKRKCGHENIDNLLSHHNFIIHLGNLQNCLSTIHCSIQVGTYVTVDATHIINIPCYLWMDGAILVKHAQRMGQ